MISISRSISLLTLSAALSLLTQPSPAKDFSTTVPQDAPVLLQQQGILEPGDRTFAEDSSLFDTYNFTGQEGQTIRLSLTDLTFDAFLALLDASGTQIAASADLNTPDTGDRNPELEVVLPTSGTYTIIVNGRDQFARGAYELTVRGVDAGYAPALSSAVDRLPEFGSASLSQDVGWQAVGNPTLNALSLPVYRYVGDCPGGGVGRITAVFRSATTAPADKLEVEIRNVTAGIDDDPYPNIERNYDEGSASDRADMGFSADQIRVFIGRRTMAVMPGLNQFEYEIKDGDRVVEQGEFATRIVPMPIVRERSSQQRTEQYCRTGGSVSNCDRDEIRTRYIWQCPTTEYPIPREFESLFSELFD
jgi:hypothetical protein